MDQTSEQAIRTVGIIGGGKRGLHLLELFVNSPLARVVYVVDIDKTAPALGRARQENVDVFTEIDQAMTAHTVDFIFEVTGSRVVADSIKQKLKDSTTELITHDVVFIILQVVEHRDNEVKNKVSQEILGIESEIKQSLAGIQQLVAGIHDISEGMNMLSLNARIEAARAGDQGQGFAVVAQKMGESVGSVQTITREIKKISGKILAVSTKIEMSLNNLN
jgi:methyl-accepting chemotaxis protein